MLEPCVNQASGLSALSRQVVPRLIAVASHGQQQGELPLLWSLCSAWVDMGMSVLVLDGHSQESSVNPGLLQIISAPLRQMQGEPEPSPWKVLPAARGFDWLQDAGFDSHTVGDLFQRYGVVLVYAAAPCLAVILKDSGLAPLLVVPPLKSASLSAYQAIKQLLLEAGLEPTVANINLPLSRLRTRPTPGQTLQDCARSFLGLNLHPVRLSAMASTDQSAEEITRLALQLLENAVMLEPHPADRTH
jgi:hypothetical protein